MMVVVGDDVPVVVGVVIADVVVAVVVVLLLVGMVREGVGLEVHNTKMKSEPKGLKQHKNCFNHFYF